MESSAGTEVARLERELDELRARTAEAEAEAVRAEDAERLRTTLTGGRRKRWTPIAIGIGLVVAAALAVPVESLFTTPRMAPDCQTPRPRGEAIRAFDRGFRGPGSSQP